VKFWLLKQSEKGETMSKKLLISVVLSSLFIAAAQADQAAAPSAGGKTPGPCEQIKQACLSAGFIPNDAKQGKGLWMDCVNPIVQGTTAKKSVIALPSVDPTVVAACKAKHPKFGEGKVGN
jgi:hypothetical protein